MGLTDEDRKRRLLGVGASEFGKLLGRSRWGSPMTVWLAKVDPVQHEESPAQKRGRMLEDAVLEWWREDADGEILSRPETTFHPEYKHVCATPDALGRRPGLERLVVEAKTARFLELAEWGAPFTDEIPTDYLFQTVEMGVMGIEHTDLPVLVAGDELRIYRITFEPELFGVLADAAEKFWRDHVEPRVPPKLDGSDAGGAWLRRRYPRELSPDMLPATTEVEDLMVKVWNVRRNLKQLGHDEEELKQQLCSLIGDARGFLAKKMKATWTKNRDSTVVDWKAAFVEAFSSAELLLSDPNLKAMDAAELRDTLMGLRAAVIREATTTREGARVLRVTTHEEN
jgi:predicted phage-related endonuclease